VFYPATGTTKLDIIRYCAEVSAAMLPQVQGRPATRKRWPEGVDQASFVVKDLQPGTPAWSTRVQIPHSAGRPKFYPVFDSPAALAWLGQVAALELHVPQMADRTGRRADGDHRVSPAPGSSGFDLDPGPGAGLAECVDVALALRERLGPLGQRVAVATSGYLGVGGNAEGSALIS
jgi:bifunctional non-homologous end joining protein LigD